MNANRWLLIILLWMLWIGATGCQRTRPTPIPGPPPDNLLTEDLLHYQVVSAEGTVIGPVDGLVVETESAEADYVVVRIKDIYDFGKGSGGAQDRFLMIPWSHLSVDATNKRLVVNVDAAALAEAPTAFDLPNTATPMWDEETRLFWAQQ